MKLRLPGLLVLLSSAASASCLADIPELTGSTGSGGAGGATTSVGPTATGPTSSISGSSTSGATTTGSTATSWCDEQDPSIEFCADFDGVGAVDEGWTDRLAPMGTHVELAERESVSSPRSAHIWVEASAPTCSFAHLRKTFVEDPGDPAIEIGMQALAAPFGIIAEVAWERGTTQCAVLVYLLDDPPQINLAFRAQPQGLQRGFGYLLPEQPFDEWRDIRIHLDRANRTYRAWYDGDELVGDDYDDNESWFAVCTDPAMEGDLDFKIGSYCVPAGVDPATDTYFDNVTFDFQ